MLDLLTSLTANVWYFFLIVVFFGGSIFVHELGHFLAARRRGLKIDRFSIGFGPKIFGWTRHGVEYRVSWIPLGGYVALPQLADMRGIEGEPATEAEALPPISYSDKMIVAVMGAVFNVLFAFALASLLWAIRQPVSAVQMTTTIGYVVPTVPLKQPDGSIRQVTSAAAEADLRVGDVIRSIDGRTIRDWRDVMHAILTGAGRTDDGRREATFVIERDGTTITKELFPRRTGEQNSRQVGIAPDFDVFVHAVPENSAAAAVGLQPGDRLVSIDGTPIRNEQTYIDVLLDQPDQALALVVERQGRTETLTVPPRPQPPVEMVFEGTIAARIGLRAGDRLLALNGEPITNIHTFIRQLDEQYAQPLQLGIRRGERTFDLAVPARRPGEKIGFVPTTSLGELLTAETHWIRVNPFQQIAAITSETYYTLASLLNPRSDVRVSDMSGPIGIGSIFYQAARENIHFVLWITVLVNINLAIFNLLPIPVLDGGHMLFATIGKIRGRALPPAFLVATQSVFTVLLACLFIYVTFFGDVRRMWSDYTRPTAVEAPPPPAAPE